MDASARSSVVVAISAEARILVDGVEGLDNGFCFILDGNRLLLDLKGWESTGIRLHNIISKGRSEQQAPRFAALLRKSKYLNKRHLATI